MILKRIIKLLKPVVVAVNGELVDVAKIGQIAALPNKDQAIHDDGRYEITNRKFV